MYSHLGNENKKKCIFNAWHVGLKSISKIIFSVFSNRLFNPVDLFCQIRTSAACLVYKTIALELESAIPT